MTIDASKLRLPALLLATALVVVTRVPGDAWIWTAIPPILAVAIVGLGYASVRDDEPGWRARLTVVLFLGLIVVPPTDAAILSLVPGWLVVLVSLVALHHYYTGGRQRPPTLDLSGGSSSIDPRVVPVALLAAAALVAPVALATVLPARWGSLFAWEAATGPLIGGVLVAGALICLVVVREGFDRLAAARKDNGGDGR